MGIEYHTSRWIRSDSKSSHAGDPERLRAFGAPGAGHDWDALESRAYCPDCDTERTHGVDLAGSRSELTCTECGNLQG
ncbi:hypothetical protein ACFQMA_17100 [Halosimplex aquaticum]|uniref:Uncharacterized protein n=1 Tax=Halosimplex aquaticum TaxID=3026162 RepID=A0ABD5Y7Q1_9EURY|nr:hypothetical protein [Halosimplex aquaticum]